VFFFFILKRIDFFYTLLLDKDRTKNKKNPNEIIKFVKYFLINILNNNINNNNNSEKKTKEQTLNNE